MARTWARWLSHALLTALALAWMSPLLWVILLSLTPNEALARGDLAPRMLTTAHYQTLLAVSQAPRWFLNSLLVAGTMTAATLVLSSLAGYALARIPFRGRNGVFLFIVAGLAVPEQAIFLPLHRMFAELELHNTYTALIAPRLAGPFGVFLMTQFFRAVPREMEEAAELDHAGRVRTFLFIMLPLARPALTTLGIFTFLYAWNDFLWPMVSATDPDMYTLTVGLSSLQGNFAQSESLGFVMASAVVASSPMILVYLLFQRYIVRGMALGGVR
ncbi:carbohydrate ABC transporter permease [Polyangium sp. y55x31]|uniref:carbohydrate ABC transporter permease n=1 Tax=Polyangium sp. y55x31 TaxID=3042688 RepID=UPI002482410A|nr:carbohydrate ABC transporter permease [Polyangium sp. y55x31]MDI1475421.1 carbohydrate ABC transporter permease [Polyangium sp. y55x31]